jgi:hypothetical protein
MIVRRHFNSWQLYIQCRKMVLLHNFFSYVWVDGCSFCQNSILDDRHVTGNVMEIGLTDILLNV